MSPVYNPPASSYPTRQSTQFSTASLAAAAEESGTVSLAKSWRCVKLATNRPARVRLYTTAAKRTADIARAVGVDPTGDHGLLLEVVTGVILSYDLSPVVDGDTQEALAAIAYQVTNLDVSTGVVTTTLDWFQTEA